MFPNPVRGRCFRILWEDDVWSVVFRRKISLPVMEPLTPTVTPLCFPGIERLPQLERTIAQNKHTRQVNPRQWLLLSMSVSTCKLVKKLCVCRRSWNLEGGSRFILERHKVWEGKLGTNLIEEMQQCQRGFQYQGEWHVSSSQESPQDAIFSRKHFTQRELLMTALLLFLKIWQLYTFSYSSFFLVQHQSSFWWRGGHIHWLSLIFHSLISLRTFMAMNV